MINIASILKDPKLQEQFEQDGFVKVRLLDLQKAKTLYDYYIQHQKKHAVVDGLYHSTTHTNNPDLILQIDQYLKAELLPEVGKVFEQYEPMMCTYITKQPGLGSETRLHQDPTFVDETKYVSANVWVGLHDIGHQNGNLFFVKGSHRLVPSLRVTPDCPTAYDGVKDLLQKNLTEVPVSAGEAILINHATVHGATPNLSNEPRIAAVMAIRSLGADWIYHYLQPGEPYNRIEKYQVDLDTFVHLEKDGRPEKGNFMEHIRWDFPQISREDFLRKMEANRNQQGHSWLNALSKLKEKLLS